MIIMRDSYESALEAALSELEMAWQLLHQEVVEYPSPISGCDVQFNRLLGDRIRISNAIRALEDHPFIATPRVREPGGVSETR